MGLTAEQLVDLYTQMLTIRRFEERVIDLYAQGRMPGFVHLSIGEEAIAAGTCANLRADDYILSTHRGHGHLIARGGEPKLMMAELYGKATGYCKGKGGSMHIADADLGFLGANGIIGGGFPIAIGTGFSARYRGTDQVTIVFFGDGASNQSSFHEGLNFASIWKLPVVFLCQNNFYAISLPQSKHQNIRDIADRGKAYGIPGVVVDGNDVVAVHEAVGEAVRRARAGEGPTLLECKTYRHRGHFEGDPDTYRPAEEVAEWKRRDPIPRLQAQLVTSGELSDSRIAELEARIKARLDEAVKFAEESPLPDPSELYTDVYSNPIPLALVK